MTKTKIYFILLAVTFTIAGYFLFKSLKISEASWKYIPVSSVVVVSSSKLQDSTYNITEASIDAKRLPFLDVASDNLSLLNLLTSNKRKIFELLHKKNITYSFHPRSTAEWGVLIYIPVTEVEQKWLVAPDNQSIRALHHNFQNTKITDIYDLSSHPLFSYIIKDDLLIASYYGELIEEVLRTTSLDFRSGDLRSKFSGTEQSIEGTNIYLQLDAWKAIIPQGNQTNHFNLFTKALPLFQDYYIENDKKEHSDFIVKSIGDRTPDYYLAQLFKNVAGAPFQNQKYISQQTSILYRYASKSKSDFHENFLDWHKNYKSESWEKLKYHIGEKSALFINNFGSEILYCQLEENNSITDAKILLAEYSGYEALRTELQKIAQLSNEQVNASKDKFQGYDIFSININEFPSAILGPSFVGFPKTYVTYIAPFLVMSNNAQVLQNYIVDFENQITWKQSPIYDSILTDVKNSAQISMVANLRKLQADQNTKSYSELTAKIESIQFSCRYDNKTAFPQIKLIPKHRPTAAKVLNRTFLNLDIEWPVLFDAKLAALQNPIEGTSELLLTNDKFELLHINNLKTGKIENIGKLDGNITSEAYKVDFLNIGRQQNVFATNKSVYAIDQDEAQKLSIFSQPLPSGDEVKNLYLIDGGADGSNRFVIISKQNQIYLWESVTSPLLKLTKTFYPEDIQGPILALNQIGNRGLIVTQTNGKVFLIGERGAIKQGFPTDLLTRISSPFTWVQNRENGQTELVGVTNSGQLTRVNLAGKIVSKNQLIRTQPGTSFSLVFDRNSLDWILSRRTLTKIAILDKEGNELFEIKDIQPNSIIEYHFFGVDNRFISIKSGNYTTLFDLNGNRLGDKAIPSEIPIEVTYQPNYYKLLIFSKFERKIQVWSIKLR